MNIALRARAGDQQASFFIRSAQQARRTTRTVAMKVLKKTRILGIDFAAANMKAAVKAVLTGLPKLRGKYICFTNVHAAVMANEDPDYMSIQNGAAYVFADGAPIAALVKKSGFKRADRVAGPDFTEEMLRKSEGSGISHFFYGSSQKTLDLLKGNLQDRYPNLEIAGMISPPFRRLSPEEDQRYVDRINSSGADILWVGLGAPKQEKWMADHAGKINALMIGVGAAFDFHAGTVKRAPLWMQKLSLEWLFRLSQDPLRLLKRYIVTNSKFIWLLLRNRLPFSSRRPS